jgi:glucose/arabinose dehydrogenase
VTRVWAVAALMLSASLGMAMAADAPMPQPVSGFRIERIATVSDARELAFSPNGDLFIGTLGHDVDIIEDAESDHPNSPESFVEMEDAPAAGVAVNSDAVYVGTQFGVYRIDYHPGQNKAEMVPERIEAVRTSGVSSDHVTTSLALEGQTLFTSVGSSCDACRPEADDTRATIHRVDLEKDSVSLEARNIRNAVALTVNPQTQSLWAGVAGSDALPVNHPYEIFDAVTLHTAPVDYGWPSCYDDRRPVARFPASCADTAIARVVLPAYETPIGAVFYPIDEHGKYAFPERYRGGAFVTLHGSWHGPAQGLSGFRQPRVVFVPMHGDDPLRPVDWSNPDTQWDDFVTGYQRGGTIDRIGRPTGIAVGPAGSLFIADDMTGAIYRIRPAVVP